MGPFASSEPDARFQSQLDWCLQLLPRIGPIELRTKFLLSLVIVITGLTCATLFVVQRSAQQRARREVRVSTGAWILRKAALRQKTIGRWTRRR
jgi:hypothetical protein